MINSEKLKKILNKKKDKIPALLEVLHLIGNLCEMDDEKFDNIVNTALDKVLNLLFIHAQSKRTTGYMLNDSDYKALGVFERHIEKLRRKSKPSLKSDRLTAIMPKLNSIKRELNLSFRQLKKYAEEKYNISVSFSYFYETYKKVNGNIRSKDFKL